MIISSGALFAFVVSPLVTVAALPLFDPPDVGMPLDVRVDGKNVKVINMATVIQTIAYANRTYWAQNLKSDGPKRSLFLYNRKDDKGKVYEDTEADDPAEIQLWSQSHTWPATVVRMYAQAGEEVYQYEQKEEETEEAPRKTDDKTKPIRTKVVQMGIKDCLKRLSPAVKEFSPVDTATSYTKSIGGDTAENTGKVVIFETKAKTKMLQPKHVYGLVSKDRNTITLGDPSRELPAFWDFDKVVGDFKRAWAFQMDPPQPTPK